MESTPIGAEMQASLSKTNLFKQSVSVNLYGGMEPPADTIEGIYKYSGRPFIVTEFFAKANCLFFYSRHIMPPH